MIAAGLHGIDSELELEPPLEGNAYDVRQAAGADATCTTRATCSPAATFAREAFGQEVVDHYLNRAQVEIEAFEAAVTDWEQFRGFERL